NLVLGVERLDEIHDVSRAVETYVPFVGAGRVKLDINRTALVRDVLHVTAQAEVKAELADKRAAVGRVDVDPSFRRHALFGEQHLAIRKVHLLQGKQLVRGRGQCVEIMQQSPRRSYTQH